MGIKASSLLQLHAAARLELQPMQGETLLAIDPSICSLGWAILEVRGAAASLLASGAWKPKAGAQAADRFDQLVTWMYEKMLGPASDVVVEIPSGGMYRMRGIQSVQYGRAIGVCEGVAAAAGARVQRIPVHAWKGNRSKASTAREVTLLCGGYQPGTDDEADAIGLGLWFIRHAVKGTN